MRWTTRLVGTFIFIGFAGTAGAAQPTSLAPDDMAGSGVSALISGKYASIGSDTMVYLMSFWTLEFKRRYPQARIYVEAAGSATAPPALLEGRANLAPMSRPMKPGERDAFVKKFGYPPTEFRVAIDTLAVYVNKDNPIEGLTMAELETVFSDSHLCGTTGTRTYWGDLGLKGAWAERRIALFGRNRLSGTYAFFAKSVLCDGKYKSTLLERPTSLDVVAGVARNINAIGYSGIGYKTPQIRVLPLARKAGQAFVAPTPESAIRGDYPLTRFLYIYVNKPPGQPMPVLEREFLKLALSSAGQLYVAQDGFIPLSADMLAEETRKLH